MEHDSRLGSYRLHLYKFLASKTFHTPSLMPDELVPVTLVFGLCKPLIVVVN
jgi:hypothetical protein